MPLLLRRKSLHAVVWTGAHTPVVGDKGWGLALLSLLVTKEQIPVAILVTPYQAKEELCSWYAPKITRMTKIT
jgi:hypothetical protein